MFHGVIKSNCYCSKIKFKWKHSKKYCLDHAWFPKHKQGFMFHANAVLQCLLNLSAIRQQLSNCDKSDVFRMLMHQYENGICNLKTKKINIFVSILIMISFESLAVLELLSLFDNTFNSWLIYIYSILHFCKHKS